MTPALARRAGAVGDSRSAPPSDAGRRSRRAHATRDQRRHARPRSPDGFDPRVGAERRADDLHGRPSRHGAGHHRPAARGAARSLALPRGGPGRDAYGHFRVTGMPRRDRAARRRALPCTPAAVGADQDASRSTTRPTRSSRRICSPAGRGPADRKGGSWAINAMRETARACRATPCSPAQRRSASPAARASRCASITSTARSARASAASGSR